MVQLQYLDRLANDIVFLLDEEGTIVECNDRAAEAYGYPVHELVGKKMTDLRVEGAAPSFKGGFTDNGPVYEISHRRRDGTQFPAEVNLRLYESPGRRLSQAIIRDISHRKREEAKLKLDALVFDHARDAMLITDAAGCIISVNRAFTVITGYEQADVVGKNPRLLASGWHDHAFYESLWRSVETCGFWQGEIWNRRKNGQIFIERQTITAVHDADGVLTNYVSMFSDITERRRMEDQLRFQAHVLDCVGEAVIATDAEERITYWNSHAQALFGWAEAEMLGRDIQAVMLPGDDGYAAGCLRHKAAQDATWSGELELHRQDDSRFEAHMTVSPMFGEAGRFGGYIVVARDVTVRKRFETKLAFLAQYDTLTELPNRNLFRERLSQALLRADRNKTAVGLIFFDLDRFKEVNDSLGHAAGDVLLKRVSERLRAGLRSVDTLARLGGDEFTVVIEGVEQRGALGEIARKIVELVAEPIGLDGGDAHVTASVGITVYPDDAPDLENLIKAADIAMYQAKHAGRNTFQFFAPGRPMSSAALARERALRTALENEEFSVVFQPRVAADNHTVVAVEALLRWTNPQLGAISPDVFIPLAEETGLIVPIGDWALGEACRQWRQWRKKSPVTLTVNLSPQQFKRHDSAQRLLAIARGAGMDPRYLEFEITESMVMQDTTDSHRKLTLLSKAGAQVSIDDFGTGFSSVAYLRHLPVQALKIDKSFIAAVTDDEDSAAIVRATVAMAEQLGLRVVAEGVETRPQLDFLRALGCDEYQGFYFSPPVSWEEVVAYADFAEEESARSISAKILPFPARRA